MIKRVFAILAVLSLAAGAPYAMAERGDLSAFANSDKPVKVFISNVTNDTGQDDVNAGEFKDVLERSMANRKAVKFELVKNPASSDLQISAAIKKYQYLVRGPMKPSPSVGTLLLDAAATATHNYVEMTVAFMVVDTKTNKVLWDDAIAEYRKKVMTKGESFPIIYDKVARIFLWKSFGKPAK